MGNNIIQEVERVFGLSEATQRQLFEQVKANRQTLDSCNCHDFSTDLNPDKIFNKKWKCSNCGGVVDNQEKYWYEKGFEHALEVK